MDIAGLTNGAVGLAALFKTCVEVWDFVDAGRSHASGFSLLRTKLDNQRLLFIICGKNVGFGSPGGYDRLLNDPFIRPSIKQNLKYIRMIFSNTEDLVKHCGIKIKSSESQETETSQSSSFPAIFERGYQLFLESLKQNQRQVSLWKATHWSIKDVRKFENMVQNLSDLISGLNAITEAFISQARREELAKEEMDNIYDVESLEEIQRAAGRAETIISSAASVRQRRIEAATITSGDAPTFYIAPTSQEPLKEESASAKMDSLIQVNNQAILTIYHLHDMVKRLTKRLPQLLTEIRRSLQPEHSFYTWAPIDTDNIHQILGSFKGPNQTPYEDGIFHVRLDIPLDYPWVPPKCWFLTKVYHPNIDDRGAICLDILAENWTPSLHIDAIVVSICSLLDSPNFEDPIMPEIANQYIAQRHVFDATSRDWTRKYATSELIYPGTREDGFSNTTTG